MNKPFAFAYKSMLYHACTSLKNGEHSLKNKLLLCESESFAFCMIKKRWKLHHLKGLETNIYEKKWGKI